MTIRTILAAISGGAASEGAIETACGLAQRFGAHVEGLHVKDDPTDVLPLFGLGMGVPMYGDLLNLVEERAAEFANRAKSAFAAAIAHHSLPQCAGPTAPSGGAAGDVSAAWREELGFASAVVARRARFFDLVVLGRSGRVTDTPYSDAIEQTILEAGRPVLIAPLRVGPPPCDTVVVAWNDSASAARAVASAMPFLRRAQAVHVISAGKAGARPNEELAEYFAWHGITATSHPVTPVEGVQIGELLIAAARDCGADLLVMGGYGHALWREVLFGGASRQILATARLPLLITH
jgi:nucleotide-binding universal stress UspA family protein